MTMTIKEALFWASSLLKKQKIVNAEMEAEILLRHISGFDRANLLSRLDQPVSKEDIESFQKGIYQRLEHEPMQYILGYQEFYGRRFLVNKHVLIPRSETEILVEELLKEIQLQWDNQDSITIADIGTGSGAISITLALEMANTPFIHTVDISPAAITVAKKNAELQRANIVFHQGNLLKPLIEKGLELDVIVSNPPYIPQGDLDALMQEVRDYEPRQALDGGVEGLHFYKEIIVQSKKILKDNGIIAFELGVNQSEAVSEILKENGFSEIKAIQDLQHIPRVIIAKKKKD